MADKNSPAKTPRDEYEEEYLALLIKDAFRREEEQYAARIDQFYQETSKDPSTVPTAEETRWYWNAVKKFKREEFFRTMPGRFVKFSKYAACLALIALGVFAFRFASVSAFRDEIIDFWIETVERYTQYTIVTDPDSVVSRPENWDLEYYPHYIPDGFQVHQSESSSSSGTITYQNGRGDQYVFSATPSPSQAPAPTEPAEHQTVDINGVQAELYISSENCLITFERYGYRFSVSGALSQTDLVMTARSIRKDE